MSAKDASWSTSHPTPQGSATQISHTCPHGQKSNMILDSQAAAKASAHASHRDGESPDPQPLSLGQQHAKKPHSSLHPVP